MYPQSSDEGKKSRKLILFTKAKKEIERLIDADYTPLQNNTEPKWSKCVQDCEKILGKFIKDEIESTAYILRVLSNSVLSIDDNNNELVFYTNFSPQLTEMIMKGKGGITGQWEHDKGFFRLKRLGENRNTRLIMAFGPSASGKTVLGKTIIKLIHDNDDTFPATFLKIDGGDMRTYSMMYQYIINTINTYGKYPNMSGYSNLVSATVWSNVKGKVRRKNPSLFDSGIVKKTISAYLKHQKEKDEDFSISLYIPETIAWCGARDCQNKYKKYIELSRGGEGTDDWVGLYIYQHRCPPDVCTDTCPELPPYTCQTTTSSGQHRETLEGKKYSDSGYNTAEKNGLIEIKKAPGGRIIIHSSGSKDGVSKITEYSIANNTALLSNELDKTNQEVMLDNSHIKVWIEHTPSDDNNKSNIPKNFKVPKKSDPNILVTDTFQL
jgi:hypothetical protein